MTRLDDIAGAERTTMLDAASRLGLDTSSAHLVSASSRLIWHLPVDQVALTITRPGSKTADDVQAEVAAVRAATNGGVRTPPLLAEPTELGGPGASRFALPFRWIDGRTVHPTDWPAGVDETAKLGACAPEGLRRMSWPTDWPDPDWEAVLGHEVFLKFSEQVCRAHHAVDALLGSDEIALCHGDLQPANFLMDRSGKVWLIDLEYACLAPRSWDAAKLVILSRRFGEPAEVGGLLPAWSLADLRTVTQAVFAQEVQIIGWLLRMTLQGATGALKEARWRAETLASDHVPWRHLPMP